MKNRARLAPRDLAGLRAFGEDYPKARRLLVYRGRKRLRIEGVLCVPCDELLRDIVPGRDLPS